MPTTTHILPPSLMTFSPSFSPHSKYNAIHKKKKKKKKKIQHVHIWQKFANIFQPLICKCKIYIAPMIVFGFHASPGDLCFISQRFKPRAFPTNNLSPFSPTPSCPHLNAESLSFLAFSLQIMRSNMSLTGLLHITWALLEAYLSSTCPALLKWNYPSQSIYRICIAHLSQDSVCHLPDYPF